MAIRLEDLMRVMKKQANGGNAQLPASAQAMVNAGQSLASSNPATLNAPVIAGMSGNPAGDALAGEQEEKARQAELDRLNSEIDKAKKENMQLQTQLQTEQIARQKSEAEAQIAAKMKQGEQEHERKANELAEEMRRKREEMEREREAGMQEIAQREAEQRVSIAEEKAKATADIAKQNAQSYVKTTMDAQRNIAEQQKQMTDEFNRTHPVVSEGLKTQLSTTAKNMQNAVNLVNKSKVVPMPGASPAAVNIPGSEGMIGKVASWEPVDVYAQGNSGGKTYRDQMHAPSTPGKDSLAAQRMIYAMSGAAAAPTSSPGRTSMLSVAGGRPIPMPGRAPSAATAAQQRPATPAAQPTTQAQPATRQATPRPSISPANAGWMVTGDEASRPLFSAENLRTREEPASPSAQPEAQARPQISSTTSFDSPYAVSLQEDFPGVDVQGGEDGTFVMNGFSLPNDARGTLQQRAIQHAAAMNQIDMLEAEGRHEEANALKVIAGHLYTSLQAHRKRINEGLAEGSDPGAEEELANYKALYVPQLEHQADTPYYVKAIDGVASLNPFVDGQLRRDIMEYLSDGRSRETNLYNSIRYRYADQKALEDRIAAEQKAKEDEWNSAGAAGKTWLAFRDGVHVPYLSDAARWLGAGDGRLGGLRGFSNSVRFLTEGLVDASINAKNNRDYSRDLAEVYGVNLDWLNNPSGWHRHAYKRTLDEAGVSLNPFLPAANMALQAALTTGYGKMAGRMPISTALGPEAAMLPLALDVGKTATGFGVRKLLPKSVRAPLRAGYRNVVTKPMRTVSKKMTPNFYRNYMMGERAVTKGMSPFRKALNMAPDAPLWQNFLVGAGMEGAGMLASQGTPYANLLAGEPPMPAVSVGGEVASRPPKLPAGGTLLRMPDGREGMGYVDNGTIYVLDPNTGELLFSQPVNQPAAPQAPQTPQFTPEYAPGNGGLDEEYDDLDPLSPGYRGLGMNKASMVKQAAPYRDPSGLSYAHFYNNFGGRYDIRYPDGHRLYEGLAGKAVRAISPWVSMATGGLINLAYEPRNLYNTSDRINPTSLVARANDPSKDNRWLSMSLNPYHSLPAAQLNKTFNPTSSLRNYQPDPSQQSLRGHA